MDDAASDLGMFATLAAHLEVLASPTRLALLHALRTPRQLSEIRVAPSLTREGERPDRALSRQATTHHLDQLVRAGLVQRVIDPAKHTESFVLHHEMVFALVDGMRDLARLRPRGATLALHETVDRTSSHIRLPPTPRLVVAYGQQDGAAFALGEGLRWRIGRAPDCDIRIDYDPYVSSENAVLERSGAQWSIRDMDSRNGTGVDWEMLPRGGEAKLVSGSVLNVGRSVLVLQA